MEGSCFFSPFLSGCWVSWNLDYGFLFSKFLVVFFSFFSFEKVFIFFLSLSLSLSALFFPSSRRLIWGEPEKTRFNYFESQKRKSNGGKKNIQVASRANRRGTQVRKCQSEREFRCTHCHKHSVCIKIGAEKNDLMFVAAFSKKGVFCALITRARRYKRDPPLLSLPR